MIKKYHSAGKLLLTAEYVVLDGALALAVPTKAGQGMVVEELPEPTLRWTSNICGELWFEAEFSLPSLEIVADRPSAEAIFLQQVLRTVQQQNVRLLDGSAGYAVTTDVEFPKDFGLGSSSTFVANLAAWAQVDAFELNRKLFKGSGYDIAVAIANSAILYSNLPQPNYQCVNYHPPFSDRLAFLHLNKKQNSREGIRHYKELAKDPARIQHFSNLTLQIFNSTNLTDFVELIKTHEKDMGKLLNLTPVQEMLFSDYGGVIKSLGAWGGDFVLVTLCEDAATYFAEKGYPTLIPWEKMVEK